MKKAISLRVIVLMISRLLLWLSFIFIISCESAGIPEAQNLVSDADYASSPSSQLSSNNNNEDCETDMIGFELITGYVYSAPKNLIESIPGSLMLTECLETCQANDSCQSVNYETGLCVLFSSNADNNPGKTFFIYSYFYV